MWIASPAILNPSSVMAYVSNEGYLNGNYASFPSAGIRPIVRLNANVELVKLGDGYKILEN